MRTLPLLLLSINLDALAALGVQVSDSPTPDPDLPDESPTVDGLLNAFGTEAEAAGLVDVLQAHGCEAHVAPALDAEPPAYGVVVKVQVADRVCGGGPLPTPPAQPTVPPAPYAGEFYPAYCARVGLPPEDALLGHKFDPWHPGGPMTPVGSWIPGDGTFALPPSAPVAPPAPDDAD